MCLHTNKLLINSGQSLVLIQSTYSLRNTLHASAQGDPDRLRLRLAGTRRFRSRSLDRPEESEPELESESDPEPEPDDESESSESESESEEDERLAFFRSLSFPFSRSFAFSSRMRFAVPSFVLNSSGTSTEGFPAALSLTRTLGFSSCSVRDGLETYGRSNLHS